MKLLALAASTRAESLNKRLLAVAAGMAKAAGAQVTTVDYAELEAPFYQDDRGPLPANLARFADALLAHDGLLLATPEYNWSIPGGLKNVIDWLSVDARAPLAGRVVLLMCASPSIRGGVSGLLHTRVPLEHLGAWVYPQAIGIGEAGDCLRSDGLSRDKDHQFLQQCVSDFVRAAGALRRA